MMRKGFLATWLPIVSVQLGLGMWLVAGCTKQQAIDLTTVLVNIAADICQVAPQVIPAGTPAG
jgi:hypothetical protein